MNVVSGHVIAWLAAHPEVHSLSFGAKRSFCDHYLICHGASKKRGKATYDVHIGFTFTSSMIIEFHLGWESR